MVRGKEESMVTIAIPGSLLALGGAALMALGMWALFTVLERLVLERMDSKQRPKSVHSIPVTSRPASI
jgi:hypothetical protein